MLSIYQYIKYERNWVAKVTKCLLIIMYTNFYREINWRRQVRRRYIEEQTRKFVDK